MASDAVLQNTNAGSQFTNYKHNLFWLYGSYFYIRPYNETLFYLHTILFKLTTLRSRRYYSPHLTDLVSAWFQICCTDRAIMCAAIRLIRMQYRLFRDIEFMRDLPSFYKNQDHNSKTERSKLFSNYIKYMCIDKIEARIGSP